MPNYDVGITEINTQVRRLGYISAILSLLSHKTLSETLLYEKLEGWSTEHEDDIKNYANQQGYIKSTRRRTGAKRYIEFVVSLGLVGRIAGACRVTRFGKTLLPFLSSNARNNSFVLCDAERLSYLYWLLIKDSDRLLTVLEMVAKEPNQALSHLQQDFQSSYLHRLGIRVSIEEERTAREIIALRNRVANQWKNPIRYAENIVPPRLHWLLDLGLVEILNSRGKPTNITTIGQHFLDSLPRLGNSHLSSVSVSWLQNNFFGTLSPIIIGETGRNWESLPNEEKEHIIRDLIPLAFRNLRTSPARKVSLYPALIFMVLNLATKRQLWVELKDLQFELENYSPDTGNNYEVRYSHRENESYLISLPD